jgi:putative DNA primase/helicase
MSDALSRLSTGGGAGKRRLFTDDDEVLFSGKRPIVLNGITDFATQPDCLTVSSCWR